MYRGQIAATVVLASTIHALLTEFYLAPGREVPALPSRYREAPRGHADQAKRVGHERGRK